MTTENDHICDHLFQRLTLAESKYPNCAIIIAGDFNRLDVKTMKKHFYFKQIVRKPTRKNAILDLILTNWHEYFEKSCIFPPFGLSDHNTVTVQGEREHCNKMKFIFTRDKRASRKAEMARYLSAISWSEIVSSSESCEVLVNSFNKVICTRLNIFIVFNWRLLKVISQFCIAHPFCAYFNKKSLRNIFKMVAILLQKNKSKRVRNGHVSGLKRVSKKKNGAMSLG